MKRVAFSIAAVFALVCTLSAQDKNVRVIVGFNGDPDVALVAAHGGNVHKVLKSGDAVAAVVPAGAVERLRKNANVRYIEENGLYQASGKPSKPGDGTPTPPPPQETPWGVTRIGGPVADAGVRVAIVDTGLDLNHPDLAANIDLSSSFNAISSLKTAEDDNGHGSHVAGTVAAVNNAIGVVGVAPGCRLLAIKVLDRRGSGTYADVGEGIDKAVEKNAAVINMSLGGSDSIYVREAVARAIAANVVVVAASGNESASAPSYPGRYDGVLSVGAVDSNNAVASWSNRQPDVVAPGVSIKSTYKGDGYATASGTSMASPHAAAVAALIRARAPALSNLDVNAVIVSTATDLETPGTDAASGSGLVNLAAALMAVLP